MITIIKKKDLVTKDWSGGTTTQLYIYPENSSYENRDFIFRISTASVDVEESTFTKLPGISRCIMVLDGEMTLSHKTKHTVNLKKFQTDSFSGDWETTSYGKVIDFNLMTTNGRLGYIGSSILLKGEKLNLENLETIFSMAFYIVKGNINIKNTTQEIHLQAGDIAICNKDNNAMLSKLVAEEDCEIAIAIVKDL